MWWYKNRSKASTWTCQPGCVRDGRGRQSTSDISLTLLGKHEELPPKNTTFTVSLKGTLHAVL